MNTKIQSRVYKNLKFPDPYWVIQKYKELCGFIEEIPCGGEGIQGKDSTLYSLKKWFHESELHDDDAAELKEWLLYCFWAQEMLPREISKPLEQDIGLRTLNLLLGGVETFYLCDDCRVPLFKEDDPIIIDDEEDGCPWCGDCFNDQTKYAFSVASDKERTK